MANKTDIQRKEDLLFVIKSQNEIIELQRRDLNSLKSEINYLNKRIELLQNEREK